MRNVRLLGTHVGASSMRELHLSSQDLSFTRPHFIFDVMGTVMSEAPISTFSH
jgi:hypothetical protein